MSRNPMVDAVWTARTIERIENDGGSVDEALKNAGLDRKSVLDPGARIPMQSHIAFNWEMARQAGDDCFGLHNREYSDPADAGPFGYVLLHSPTLGDALRNFNRYLNVHLDAAAALGVDGDDARMSVKLPDISPEKCRHETEGGYVILLNVFRALLSDDWSPREMHFEHSAPRDSAEHWRIFGAPVRFGQPENAMLFDAALLSTRCRAPDSRLYRVMKQYVDKLLADNAAADEDELIEWVRRLISESLNQGLPKMAEVARELAMSSRTLQRRLNDRGLVFSGLIEDVRETLAKGYLAERELTLTQIAFLLGYSEISAFSRAFRRWTSASPQEYRKTLTQ